MLHEQDVGKGTVLHANITNYVCALIGARCARVAEAKNVEQSADFPGPLPTALNRASLNVILAGNREYLVCAKDDGMRCFVVLMHVDGSPRVVVWYRHGGVALLQSDEELLFHSELFSGTVLDCERVGGRYRVFDCYALAGTSCAHRGLLFRLECANTACRSTFLEVKPMVALKDLETFVEEELCAVENDGLIFTPVPDCALVEGRVNPLVFKFKPRPTLDALVKKQRTTARALIPGRHGDFELFCGGSAPQTQLLLTRVAHVPFDSQIVEFDVFEEGELVAKQPRPDKQYPNGIQTVLDIFKTIEDNVQLSELCE